LKNSWLALESGKVVPIAHKINYMRIVN
jgi:hypothetical protein